ncbi:MAG: 1-acyl-sn-glycerol-3-phosphate acyltransferase [Clostridia bacterium]|nr:1-acyl-sn-glycerol-3-phosphate acyltransferase [Clostridia bacterium]
MSYKKPNILYYRLTQLVSKAVAGYIFKRKILRNEIKNAKGPFVVIANHQAAYDFVNLIGTCKRPMTFVISNSFYQSLPIQSVLDKLAVIPKQQFQTSVSDMRRMREVILAGQPLVIYPAGLMCEDGLSTPIPAATYKLFKWLGVDVYMAKTCGTYFAMPKWTKGFRPGKTTLDIYKLFDKDELKTLDDAVIEQRTKQALLFDAYREQEQLMFKYKDANKVAGLENVLYTCPHCNTEFGIEVKDEHTLYCKNCGYSQTADEYGFFHKNGNVGQEIRYVSDWSRHIYEAFKKKLAKNNDTSISEKCAIHTVDPQKKKYMPTGKGTLTLTRESFIIEGELHGKDLSITVPIANFPTLPFSPGKYLEIQSGKDIYRCVLENGNLVMKFINMVKIFHELRVTKQ